MKKDSRKTKAHLEKEAASLRKQLAALRRNEITRKRAEEALRESTERLATAVDATGLGLWDWNVQTGDIVFGHRWASLLGYDHAELEPHVRTWERLIHPDDVAHVDAAVNAHLEGRTPYYETEHRLKAKSGEWKWVHDRGKVVAFDPQGKPLRMAGTYRDITERMQADEALRKSEERFHLIARATNDIVWDWDLLTGDHWLSEGFHTLLGYRSGGSALGNTTWRHLLHPDDQERVVAGVHAAVASGQKTWSDEYRFRRADGSYAYICDRGYVIRDGKGKPLRMLGAMQDITERKRAEEALQESESRMRAVLDSTLDAVISMDTDGMISGWNPKAEALFGWSREEAIGRNLAETIIPPQYREAHRRGLRRYLSTGEGVVLNRRIEMTALDRDGAEFPIEISIVPLLTGKSTFFTAFIANIAERKRLEEQLRQAQKMEALGTLSGGIAHDFNNLLTPILSYTGLALRTLPEDSETRPDLEQVLIAARRARALVQQILAFSRTDRGERIPVRLDRLVEETSSLLRATLPATIEIRLRIQSLPGPVAGDPTRLQQVLMNLCGNAAHAMREKGGALDIALEAVEVSELFASGHPPLQSGPHVRLTVRDSGCGMEPAVLTRIFDPFFTTKGPGAGSGLGLSLVHGIITSHGGAITVASAPGQGTAVALYLPALVGTQAEEEQPQTTVAKGSERILFVDDEAFVVRLGERMLRALGYTVVAMNDSLQALDAFRSSPDQFDLVITDETMPGMTGGALTRELLRIRPDLPIILCTGFSHTMTPEKAAALGIRAFMMKPYAMEDMAATIRRVLDQR